MNPLYGIVATLLLIFSGGVYYTYTNHVFMNDTMQAQSTTMQKDMHTTNDTNAMANSAEGNDAHTIDNDTSKSNVTPADTTASAQTVLIAGGCFWCVEADIEKLSGVISAVSGYAGGTTKNPTYENYAAGGHREVVEVTYNPSVVSFEEILIYAMKHMDPTDANGSFHDRGSYYSPAFYYDTGEQKDVITNLIADVDANGPYDNSLAIAVEPRPTFWPAEDYHQDYYKGTFSSLKYKYYRMASGRDTFIETYWGNDTGTDLPWRTKTATSTEASWKSFVKPSDAELKTELTDLQYRVTQNGDTEPAFNNAYWDNEEAGIYVDIISGEPLYSSTNKFESGTGWPSFTRPIEFSMVTEHLDFILFIPRTEIRSAIAGSHVGHVFNDGPKELGGKRYCMNSAAMRFVAKDSMAAEGYGDYLYLFE